MRAFDTAEVELATHAEHQIGDLEVATDLAVKPLSVS